ncbi:MAG: PstS family phosphate ABC transporter substrate-binding protein [Aestuariivirgaceae bacterium]|nr:PstS family phosphate ABC transporter substrate-binding protein [Aestuariivirgaceae bacterium]
MKFRSIILATTILAAASGAAHARDEIRIVGSSTVYPFTTAVAETFGKVSGKTPVVESTGTGGGFKLFCSAVGVDSPDFTNASRAIKKSEFEDCAKNGASVIEIKVGFDGLTIATAGEAIKVTKQQLFMALAKQVPDASGKLVDNPYMMWSEIDASLPATKIEVLGPPPSSGTRDSFVELVMEKGAEGFESLKALKKSDAKAFEGVWKSIREDGVFVEAGENDNLIVQKLEANKNAYGIFGFSFLEENAGKIKGIEVDGVSPSFETIASGDYKVARPLFVYAKKEHIGVIPGMAEFMAEYVSEAAMGEDGYLADKGLVALPADQAEAVRKAVADQTAMTAADVK